MNLQDVSQTAIMTLLFRAEETKKKNSIINDPMAVLCLQKLLSVASEEEKHLILRTKKRLHVFARNNKINVQRALYLDNLVNEYISTHPSCTIINLACGFDTRYWRINNKNCTYIELDFPNVISLKKELLGEHIYYEQIGCSVLDTSWVDKVTSKGNRNFLLIAEGLFMYLPKQNVVKLLLALSQKFNNSQLAFDVFEEKYTKGLWQKAFKWSFKYFLGIDATFQFGIQNPEDIESFATGFKVIKVKQESGWYFITISINENA